MTKQLVELSAKSLSRKGKTACTGCGKIQDTSEILAVRKSYQRGTKTVRMRTIAKLCYDCLEKDEDYNSDPRWF